MASLRSIFNLRKNPLVKSMGVYTFTNFFGKGASFLLLFIFTNPVYILPSENGLLSLFSNSILFLMPFLSMGILHSTSTDFFKHNKEEFRSFFSTGLIMPVSVTLFSMIILYFFRGYMEHTYGFPAMFVWMIPLITFFTFCNEQLLTLIRNNNEPMVFLKVNLTKTVLELGLSVILVVFFAWRWEGRVAGIFIAYLLLTIYAFYYFIGKNYLTRNLKKEHFINDLIFAIPVIAMQASIFTMNSSDKFFLSNYTTDKNETVGIYSVACVFASIVFLVSSALIQYVFPKIYNALASPVVNYRSIRKHFLFYLGVMVAGTIGIIILTPLAYHFINIKYHPALRYTYLLCLGNFLWGISYFFYSFLLYNKQKKKILGLSCCCIIISISLNYFFIRPWADLGAAISGLICYFIVLILTLIFTKEHWQKFIFRENIKQP